MPLRTFQLPEIAVEDFGIPDRWATVRANGKRGDSEIDANGLARRLNGFRNIFFDQDADEPLTSPLANCCGEHLDTTGGDVAMFLQAKSAEVGQLDAILKHAEKVRVSSLKISERMCPDQTSIQEQSRLVELLAQARAFRSRRLKRPRHSPVRLCN